MDEDYMDKRRAANFESTWRHKTIVFCRRLFNSEHVPSNVQRNVTLAEYADMPPKLKYFMQLQRKINSRRNYSEKINSLHIMDTIKIWIDL